MGSGKRRKESSRDTHFAPPERATGEELHRAVETVSRSPVIEALLEMVFGALAVLNPQRQILAVNPGFLEMLGDGDGRSVLGMRPGEAIRCVHADDFEGGCGTSKFCSTCGAAIAIVASLDSDRVEERDCIATVKGDRGTTDLYLRVRSCPMTLEGARFLLLFIQDLTSHQRRLELERVFFHDIGNLVMGLQGIAYLLPEEDSGPSGQAAAQVRQMAERLGKEITIQRKLVGEEIAAYPVQAQDLSLARVFEQLRDILAHHPAASGRTLALPRTVTDRRLRTDLSLLLRVLTSMLVNALEATEEGGEVRLWGSEDETGITLHVWNAGIIPEEVAPRIFQRHFTTKQGNGRGLGTFAMRLLAEEWLGGKVGFSSSEEKGTEFYVWLPA